MLHRIVVIVAAIFAISAVSVVYVVSRGMSSPSVGLPASSPGGTPTTGAIACPPTELKLTGVFNECASVDQGQSCPAGSFNQARVVLLNGAQHKFLLYLEVNGGYHGPGTYPLSPWPHASLGVADGVAKVAIREVATGALWESSAGSLDIEGTEQFGWVYAGLGASPSSPVDVSLNLAGWWSCS
ncbi:MAG: hypothetical protein ACREOM_13365 [Candidatus Dormibacteraceae bacterium]